MGNGATIDTGKLFNVGGAQHSARLEEETALHIQTGNTLFIVCNQIYNWLYKG